jgi:hypothetical protein
MVCPMCITTAVVANLPVISTSLGGVVASKVAYKHLMKRNANINNIKKNDAILTSQDIIEVPKNEVVNVSKLQSKL